MQVGQLIAAGCSHPEGGALGLDPGLGLRAVVLLVDHQTGLLQLVHDYTVVEFKQNVLALADIAKHYKLPTILTTSFEQGPNGPLVAEIKERFPDAPYIARPGQINAWDNEDFVQAIKVGSRSVHFGVCGKEPCLPSLPHPACAAPPALHA